MVRRGAIAAVVLAAVVIGAWSSATASGLSAARFGGEHGHPTTDNPTAIYYNPAGLALSKGTHIYLDGTMALRSVTYDRPVGQISNQGASALELQSNSGEASLFNVIGSPFAGVTSDFGTDWIYAGIGWYYPFGGSAVWSEDGNSAYTGALAGGRDGSQRWYSIDGTIRSMYVTAAMAFNIKPINLSIGLSGSAILSEVNTIRARNSDGSDNVTSDGSTLQEGRSHVEVSGWQGGFGIGAIWQPIPDEVWLGFSYTSQPNVSGGMTLEGKLYSVLGPGGDDETDVGFNQDLPDIYRFGVRYRPVPDWEIRIFGDYTRWSVMRSQCLFQLKDENGNDTTGADCPVSGNLDDALDNPGSYGADTNTGKPVQQNLPRLWKNAFGLRVGASYWPIPDVEIYLGAGYDSNAIPDQTLDPAITDADKGSVALGTRWQIVEEFGMAFTFTQLFYAERDNSDSAVNSQFQQQSRQPGNGGVYNQMISVFNIYADISF